MTLYEIIHNFFSQYIFNDAGGIETNSFLHNDIPNMEAVSDWLCDISTIAILIWLVICCFLFVRWLFRLFAGLIKG